MYTIIPALPLTSSIVSKLLLLKLLKKIIIIQQILDIDGKFLKKSLPGPQTQIFIKTWKKVC